MIKSAIIFLCLFFSSSAYGAQGTNDFVIPDKVYLAGTYPFTSASLANETKFKLTLSRQYWTDPKTTLDILIEISTNNGQTYVPRYKAFYTTTANPALEAFFFNTQAGTRRIRFTLTLNTDLRTSGVFHAE